MKKLVMCSLVLLVSIFCVNAQNLVQNGDFKAGEKFWKRAPGSKNRGTVEVRDGVVEIMQTERSQRTVFETEVVLKPKTTYTVSFQIKCAGMKTDGKPRNGAHLSITYKGKQILELSPGGRWTSASGTFDWKSCSITFKTHAREGSFKLYLGVRGGVGKAFFTNVIIEEQKPVEAAMSLELQPLVWQENIFYLAAGFPGCINLAIRAIPPQEPLSMTLDLPKGIALVGASPWRENPDYKTGRILADSFTVSPSRSKDHSKYTVAVNPDFASSLKPDSVSWMNNYRLYLIAEESSVGGAASLTISVGGKTLIKEKSFQLQVLPELKMPKTKLTDFRLLIASLYSLNAPTEAIRNAYLNFWLGLVERPITFPPYNFSSYPEELRNKVTKRFDTWCGIGSKKCTPFGHFATWEKKKGVSYAKVVFANGKKGRTFCPSFMEDASNPVWNEYLRNLVTDRLRGIRKNSPIQWNFEPGAKDYCFCEVCRKKFSDSINAGKTLTADEIIRSHARQWFSFRVRQHARIMKVFSQIIRKYFPGHPVALCTDPLAIKAPHVAEWCGVDIRMVDNGEFDMFKNMLFHEGVNWYDELVFNLKSVKTPQFMSIDPSEPSGMFYKRFTPEGVFMNIVAAAALGTPAISFSPYDNFDGRYLHTIADASGLIAKVQDCYATEKRCDSIARVTPENVIKMEITDGTLRRTVNFPDFDSSLRHTIHRNGNRIIATIFNYNSGNALLARLAFPELEKNPANSVICHNNAAGYPDVDIKEG
ncbi:MAG: carbohydrate binding domain-containing protein, partial [Victivallales bacterium]|nr:carbohydrate binding domain-containing protein [Victivallales bacterium]